MEGCPKIESLTGSFLSIFIAWKKIRNPFLWLMDPTNKSFPYFFFRAFKIELVRSEDYRMEKIWHGVFAISLESNP